MEKTIVYKNRKFTIGTKQRYYFATIKGKNWSLHRYKYTCEKSEIPTGWHVHHKDHNCFNNDISNLEIIEPNTHYKEHPTDEKTLKKWQVAGIKAAPVWHASEEGKEWHKINYEKYKDKLQATIKSKCSFCEKDVITKRKKTNCFCSNKCKSAWRRKNKPDKKIASCQKCGKDFETLKYLPNRFCSKQCKPAPNPEGFRARLK